MTFQECMIFKRKHVFFCLMKENMFSLFGKHDIWQVHDIILISNTLLKMCIDNNVCHRAVCDELDSYEYDQRSLKQLDNIEAVKFKIILYR